MDKKKRHYRAWRFFYVLLHGYLSRKFKYTHDICEYDGPCMIISNHVTNWDPVLLGLSFPKKQVYYVASEHLFRKGIITKFLNRYFEPIPRSKGNNAIDTVLKCKRHAKDGDNVCIFAEGDSTWNGLTDKIVPSTAQLVKSLKVALITYKFEGGHLANPRWGIGARKGKMHGGVVKIYSPEELKAMSYEEIEAAINNDINENAWERQEIENISYKGKKRAERIESALFMCPQCKSIGTVKGVKNDVVCSCGFKTTYTEKCFFDPPVPFKNTLEWDKWQMEQLLSKNFNHSSALFEDNEVTINEIEASHGLTELCKGKMSLYDDKLCIGDMEFDLEKISGMSIIQTHILVFTYSSKYFEIKGKQGISSRKYLAWYQNFTTVIKNSEMKEV